ncbi:hypothetical protein LCGC14_2452720 [marine sediment metagenome]|uniref:Uncharacterized protein n=1 Tax=marine sediment metagenome TaxID=412755 RepID=A0A0F9DSS6_9ZZZZ
MAEIYGWSYADFNTFVGWDMGTQAKYEAWENKWARKIDAYIFTASGTSPRLTGVEATEVGDIVNELMVLTNIYLKGETVENPLEMGMIEPKRFPQFIGDPEANKGLGTDHYRTLNKLKRKHSEISVTSFRIGVIPSDSPFYQDKLTR